MLEANHLFFNYSSKEILKDISLQAGPGLIALIGPNAAGKTTMIRCLAGALRPDGAILVQGRLTEKWNKKELTEIISHLPQKSNGKALLSVFESVLLGRISRLSWRVSDHDLNSVWKVLQELNLSHLASTPLNELSGGLQQMVSIAQALVKQPKILLMDEPTNNLDLCRQLEVFELITGLTRKRELTTIMALHDLNFAARFADMLIVLNKGKIHSSGSPSEVLSEFLLSEVYGVEAKIIRDNQGIPQVFPIGSINSKKTLLTRDQPEPQRRSTVNMNNFDEIGCNS